MSNEYKHGDITSGIIAAAMKVHSTLKSGFQEIIYHRALEIEFRSKNLLAQSEKEMPIYYEGIQIGIRRVDFLIEKKVCVEIKAVTQLEDVHLAQALNYIEAYNIEVGLLINFGSKSLEFKRLLNKKFIDNIINP